MITKDKIKTSKRPTDNTKTTVLPTAELSAQIPS